MCERMGECRSEEFLIRQSNPGLFALCTDAFLGKEKAHVLLDILKHESDGINEESLAIQIRNMVEEILDLMISRGVIPNGVDVQKKSSIIPRALKLRNVAINARIPSFIPDALVYLCDVSSICHSDTMEKKVQEAFDIHSLERSFIMALRVVMEWLGPFLESFNGESVQVGEDLLPGYLSGKLYPKTWFVKLDDGKETAEIRNKDTRSYKKGSDVQVKLSDKENTRGLPIIDDIKPLNRG